MPKISVIVPVYNTEKFLHSCIGSILSQTFTDFELLLINDGSNDNSGTICDEYAAKDSRVKSYHISNRGANNARLKGIQESIGKYVMFVDSDDTISNNYLDVFYHEIDESSVDVVIRTENIKRDVVDKHTFMSDMCGSRVSVRLVDKAVRKDVLLSVYKELPRDIVLGEDFMQSLFIANGISRAKYFINDEIIYFYTNNDSSTSHTNDCTYWYEKRFYSVLETYSDFCDQNARGILLMSKINGLIKVIMYKNKIDYSDSYFVSCKNDWRKLGAKTIENNMLFRVQNEFICHKLICVKRFLQMVLHRFTKK